MEEEEYETVGEIPHESVREAMKPKERHLTPAQRMLEAMARIEGGRPL